MAGANRVPGLRWSLTTQGRRAIASSALPNFCHRSQTKQNALLNDARALQISSISLIAPLAVSLVTHFLGSRSQQRGPRRAAF